MFLFSIPVIPYNTSGVSRRDRSQDYKTWEREKTEGGCHALEVLEDLIDSLPIMHLNGLLFVCDFLGLFESFFNETIYGILSSAILIYFC